MAKKIQKSPPNERVMIWEEMGDARWQVRVRQKTGCPATITWCNWPTEEFAPTDVRAFGHALQEAADLSVKWTVEEMEKHNG